MGDPWTDEEKRIVAEMYPDHFATEISEKIGRPLSGIYRMAQLLGLKSSPEKYRRAAEKVVSNPNHIASRFKKGHVPANKGKRMSPEQYARCAGTMFKKGNVPKCHRPVGSERVNVDGYVEVKVAEPNKWRPKHRVEWEKAYGPIPEGCNIQFRNGNSQDIRLENLYMISKADQMGKENSIHARYPEELKQVIRLKGRIKRRITEMKRKENHGEEC